MRSRQQHEAGRALELLRLDLEDVGSRLNIKIVKLKGKVKQEQDMTEQLEEFGVRGEGSGVKGGAAEGDFGRGAGSS